MLISDKREIGNRLLIFRKKAGYTQAEAAEQAGLSDRAYAEIERGAVNMRIETLVNICNAFQITPNELFLDDTEQTAERFETLLEEYRDCTRKQQKTVVDLLSVYLSSLK